MRILVPSWQQWAENTEFWRVVSRARAYNCGINWWWRLHATNASLLMSSCFGLCFFTINSIAYDPRPIISYPYPRPKLMLERCWRDWCCAQYMDLSWKSNEHTFQLMGSGFRRSRVSITRINCLTLTDNVHNRYENVHKMFIIILYDNFHIIGRSKYKNVTESKKEGVYSVVNW